MTDTQLQNILEQGEGQYIEFKEKFNKSLQKEIVAFANASGGVVYLGSSFYRYFPDYLILQR